MKLFKLSIFLLIVLLISAGCGSGSGRKLRDPALFPGEPRYMRGDTAIITGKGFEPNHQVIVKVIRADGSIVKGDGTNTPGSDTVTTDPYGNFTYVYILDGGPDEAYEGTFKVRAIDAPNMIELATTRFMDDPTYLLQGCTRDKGDCTPDDPLTGWADGADPVNGWTSGNLKGWFELENVPYRLRINLRKAEDARTYYNMNEHDYLRNGIYGIDNASNFYVGAGPSVPGYTEGALTKTCVYQTVRYVGDNPTKDKPCIVTGPTYSGVNDDGDLYTDEESIDGIDNDGDGKIDEDPGPQSMGSADSRIQYTWTVLFDPSEAGNKDKEWALYWLAHLASGSSNYPGASLHTHTAATGSQDVPINIPASNDPPMANNDTAATMEDMAITINVLSNDTDIDGTLDPASVAVVSGPANGSTSVNITTGAITYMPGLNFNGTDSFAYTVKDNHSATSNVATVTVTVTTVNDPPVAYSQSVTTVEDTSVPITLTGNDVDGDPLSFIVVSGPTNGALSGVGSNLIYTPSANFNGSDIFTFKVNDGAVDSNIAIILITVTSMNDPPVVNNDTVSITEDTAVTINVLANDTDPDGMLNPTSVTVVTGPTNGSATINDSGSITYTPNSNFYGQDSFTYTVKDNLGATSNIATVTVAVTSVNDPPVVYSQSAVTAEDTSIPITLTGSDVDGDPLSFIVVSGPSSGALSGSAPNLTYMPNTNFSGSDSFTFKVNDVVLDSNIATVLITVTPLNDPPVASDDTATVVEDSGANTINVLANDTTAPDTGETLTITGVTQGGNGTVAITGGGTGLTYTPNLNYNGVDSFTYTVSDSNGGTATATVTVTVTSVNDQPVAINDTATTTEDTAVAIDVLSNDTDVDGTLDPASVVVVGGPVNGLALVNTTTGEITYTPSLNFTGMDSFTYTMKDTNESTSNVATVMVTVSAVNDPPIASNDSASTLEDNGVTINVLTNDTDPDGTLDPVSVTVVTAPTSGSTVVNADGTITYTPALNFNGTDSFTYTVKDNNGAASNVATVTVTVTPVNDLPVAYSQSVTTAEDTSIPITLIGSDVDGDSLSFIVVSGPSSGALSGVAPNLIYTPALNFNGSDSFTFKVNDGTVDSNIATVLITVTSMNDSPVASDDSATTSEDIAVTMNVLSNDTDPDGTLDLTSVEVVTVPANGSTALNVDGTVTYTPNLNFNGTDSFTYAVKDNLGALSNVATVTVTVTPVNDPPVASDDTATTTEDTAVAIDVLFNDTDVDGTLDPASVVVVGGPVNGLALVNTTTGEITYTPSLNFIGMDSFTYTMKDTNGSISNVATVMVTVGAVNDPPVANDDSATTSEDTVVSIAVISNDTDPDGLLDPATVTVVTGPANGTASINTTTGEITYTPSLNFTGTDSFTYTVDDNIGATSNQATVTITVSAAPITEADLSITKTDSPDPVPLVGQNLTYTITVTNNGPSTATSVTVTDTLPPTVTLVSAIPSQGTCTGTSPITCYLGAIGSGASAIITIKIMTGPPAGMIGNTANVSSDNDPNTANNTVLQTTNVGNVSRLLNISTRAFVGTGDDVEIGGFIISGSTPKTVLIRGRGPSMGGAPFNVQGTLPDPFLQIYSFAQGAYIAQNDDWQVSDPLCATSGYSCGVEAEIIATGLSPCVPNPEQTSEPPGCANESAILVTLPPGNYSAILSGVGSENTGVGLVEVFDTDGSALPKLTNISTRAEVLTGDSVEIGGFIIGAGTGNKTVLIRARGPSMGGAPFNISGTLPNPAVKLYSFAQGAYIAQNDDWQVSDPLCVTSGYACGGEAEIITTGLDPCQPNPEQTSEPPGCANESAILITLPPGSYSAVVSGVGTENNTGVGLVEVFEVSR